MFIVMSEYFDPELHSIWGPFRSRPEAEQWAEGQPEEEHLTIIRIEDPYQPFQPR